jgi:hypothetical protein
VETGKSVSLRAAMNEVEAGLAFWRGRGVWPADLHNSDYVRWASENPHGNFTNAWWQPFLRTLHVWRATRPFSGAELTSRFLETADRLGAAWREVCAPRLDDDVSTVTWDEIEPFPMAVGTIKPTRTPSPVFTSKFCHFLLPRIFPVVDAEGLGNRWPTYQAYFRFVQSEWASTEPPTRAALTERVTDLIQRSGEPAFSGFPMTNKIVELRLIGRHHPL